MPTTKQRREAARRHLERQLQRREEREAARKRFTLIASILGTVILIALVTVFVVVVSGDHTKKNTKSAASDHPTVSSPTTTPSAPSSAPPSTKARAAKGPTVTFNGVSVVGAADLGGAPAVTAKSSSVATKLGYKDLVVGKGAPATPASSVTVQYVGALYKDGKIFDSSWARGSAATFSLTGVVPGFTQGIGGTTGVPAMKVGGRRIMILPSALGYGPQGSGTTIPPNASLVFVVDLKSIGAA
ncbi:MAG: FKBP-type peptidyl-prolyl cis-trans isomerase [Pseudonocardiales bacterium]|nr:FKBP-type peptidyl-prolyl cis-trans isomerase [Actinomycetota bacterium]